MVALAKRYLKSSLILCMFFLFIPAPLFGDLLDDPAGSDGKSKKPLEKPPEAEIKVMDTDLGGVSKKEDESPIVKTPPPKTPRAAKPVVTKKPKPKSKKPSKNAIDKKEPIYYKSEGKSVYTKLGKVILEDNVVISQGELRFRADKAEVFLDADNPENDVEKVEVTGNVRITKTAEDAGENMKASGNSAFFFNVSQHIDLVGNARIWKGGHLIRGKKITYFVETGMITVDGAEGVVQPGNQ